MRSCAFSSSSMPSPPPFFLPCYSEIRISQRRADRVEDRKKLSKITRKNIRPMDIGLRGNEKDCQPWEVYDAFGRKVSEPTTRPQRALINRNCSRLLRRMELLERRSGFKPSFLQRFFSFFFWQFFDRKPSRVIRCFVRDRTIAKLLLFSANNGRV